jgi:hypothetical protein
MDHPLLDKAREQFVDGGAQERIRAIDDRVLFKIKRNRWRGAGWLDASRPRVVAAGRREAGSTDDFYAQLAREGRAARARYNATHSPGLTTDTFVDHLLPEPDDYRRYELESVTRLVRRIEETVRNLTLQSVREGAEHSATFDGFTVGILVQVNEGHETYVAVRVVGSVPAQLMAIVLRQVPGCATDGWYPEFELPHRSLHSNEQAWSNLMDPDVAAKLLDE